MIRVMKFGVMRMASLGGLYGVFIGLIFGIFTLILSFILPSIPMVGNTSSFGFMGLILFPIGYGIMGFLSGLIFTPIMNLALKIIKGIDLELVTVAQ